jgi:PIN domain nuclease of toxin-antitoxin system
MKLHRILLLTLTLTAANVPEQIQQLADLQAMVEEMTVLTSDREFERYPIDVIWCGK